jgi:hypothetical protein
MFKKDKLCPLGKQINTVLLNPQTLGKGRASEVSDVLRIIHIITLPGIVLLAETVDCFDEYKGSDRSELPYHYM